ncbi:MAG: DUF2083 domain-containing protein [Rhodobacteraceae bacterium]|nr:DUF2083 domain-containing protein [Paracoccaceae bacterium]
MPQGQLTGTRIRQRRLERGIRQAQLATELGISASYLNLIEHNRRRIGGKLLNAIARILEVDRALLSEGAEGALLDEMRGAAVAFPAAKAETALTEDFAGRLPGWARLVAAQATRLTELEQNVAALTDRLTHDPLLAASLHQVISSVTSIRATSSILVSGETLDQDWQGRFHRNIYEDSQRLSDESRILATYLEAPDGAATALIVSPLEELERSLDKLDQHIPALEGDKPVMTPREVARGLPGLSKAGISLAQDWLNRYRADAMLLPLETFGAAALACGHDPDKLIALTGAPAPAVLRRLSTLPPSAGHPAFGLAQCDASGTLTRLRVIPGFTLPRAGGCPLWPVYQALGQPGRPLWGIVSLPGERGARLLCHAAAGPRSTAGFDTVPVMDAVMLVRNAPVETSEQAATAPNGTGTASGVTRMGGVAAIGTKSGDALPIGSACRVCPRENCQARREPSILASVVK